MDSSIAARPAVLSEESKVEPTGRRPPSSNSGKKLQQTQQSRSPMTSSSPTSSSVMPSINSEVTRQAIEEQIRERAYQLFIERGSRDGHAVQDWLDAELELLANR
jgi:hypothetical protein